MTETTDERLDRVEQGLDALFATDVAKEILVAVDFEAILSEGATEDPVDVERLASTLGRPIGHLLADRVLGGSGVGGLAKRTVGTQVGGRVAEEAIRVGVERVDPEDVASTLVEIDAESPGPALADVVEPYVEDSDILEAAPVARLTGEAEPPDSVTDGVHDAAGGDHTGALEDAGDGGGADATDGASDDSS